MPEEQAGNLRGLVVLALESRRATQMAGLIRRHGGSPLVAPSLREVAIEENREALAFLGELEARRVDAVILLTGVGTRTFVAAVANRCSRERVAELLRSCRLIARGPKPVAALRELGLQATLVAPEPNTWRELLAALDRELPVAGWRVAVLEYGQASPELLAGLRGRGAEVISVPVYRWSLPEDTQPLRHAVAELCAGRVDVALFTSATQVDHLFLVARQEGVDDEQLCAAFAPVLIASIGPVCSEAIKRHGLRPDLEPDHPKMGHLVSAVARRGRQLLRTKRGR